MKLPHSSEWGMLLFSRSSGGFLLTFERWWEALYRQGEEDFRLKLQARKEPVQGPERVWELESGPVLGLHRRLNFHRMNDGVF